MKRLASTATTFAVLKPDLVANPPKMAETLAQLRAARLRIRRAAFIRLSAADAHRLYAEHSHRFYFGRLIRHIRSGPAVVMELESDRTEEESDPNSPPTLDDPIALWRRLCGPSKFLRGFGSQPNENSLSIRWNCALSDVRNSVHGADSAESAKNELSIFADRLQIVTDAVLNQWLRMEDLTSREANSPPTPSS